MKMKLEQPVLIELDDMQFFIVDELDLSNLKHMEIDLKGFCYNYENAIITKQWKTLAVYNLKENAIFSIDENNEIIE